MAAKRKTKREEILERSRVEDKTKGIYNRFHIVEEEIIRAKEWLMKKYKMTEIEALTKIFNLAFDKKLELELDTWEYHKTGLKTYKIRNLGKI